MQKVFALNGAVSFKSETPKSRIDFFFLLAFLTLLPLFPRGSKCWMLKCLPGETGVGRRNEGICSARECCLKPQDVFLTHRYYYICPPCSLCPMGLSYALICFKVGAFEDDSVLTCCW